MSEQSQPARKCPFCPPRAHEIIAEHALAVAIRDSYPLTRGHALVVPRRHIQSFFELTAEERSAMLDLLARAKAAIDREHGADAYNIGINDGAAAGQTVMHVHMHLIPRYKGDADDPRGGVRWIFPRKAAYWDEQEKTSKGAES